MASAMAQRRPARAGRYHRLLGAIAASVLVGVSTCAAQTPTILYFYDELDRLSRVVDPQGNIATYTYDAVGNLLGIERVDASAIPGPVAITLVTPDRGTLGATVEILGKGFASTPEDNAVAFTGAPAAVTAATFTRLVTRVPPGATSGPITVTTPLGTATSPTPFRITGLIAVAPPGAVVLAGATRQFTASDPANPGSTFTWRINGIAGGNASVGTVTPAGLYTAPASVPSPPAVTLTAIATGSVEDSAAAPVLIVAAPLPAMQAARGVSVLVQRPPASSPTATSTAAPVSARVQTSSGSPSSATSAAAPVSARVEAPGSPSPGATGAAAPVSVRVQTPSAPSSPTTSAAAPVSAGVRATASPTSATSTTSGVAVAFQPLITAVNPASAPAGAANVSVTLFGSGFGGATSVTFLRNNAADAAFTVTSVTVNATGTQATFTIAIAASAPAGGRVVRITTPGGSSTAAGLAGNIFTVQ
jgi:YD repeat-containing protein